MDRREHGGFMRLDARWRRASNGRRTGSPASGVPRRGAGDVSSADGPPASVPAPGPRASCGRSGGPGELERAEADLRCRRLPSLRHPCSSAVGSDPRSTHVPAACHRPRSPPEAPYSHSSYQATWPTRPTRVYGSAPAGPGISRVMERDSPHARTRSRCRAANAPPWHRPARQSRPQPRFPVPGTVLTPGSRQIPCSPPTPVINSVCFIDLSLKRPTLGSWERSIAALRLQGVLPTCANRVR